MSWFEVSGYSFANIAKSALTNAQKSIDKALDIQTQPGGSAGNDERGAQQPEITGLSGPGARRESQKTPSRTTLGSDVTGDNETQKNSPTEPRSSPSKLQRSPRGVKSDFWEEFLTVDHPKGAKTPVGRKARTTPAPSSDLNRGSSPDETALLASATKSMDRGSGPAKSRFNDPSPSPMVPEHSSPDPLRDNSMPPLSPEGVGGDSISRSLNVEGTTASDISGVAGDHSTLPLWTKARTSPSAASIPGSGPEDQTTMGTESPKSGSDRYDSSESESIEVISLASTGVGGNDLARDLSPLVVRVPRLLHRKNDSDTSGSQPSPPDDDDRKSGSTVEVIPESIPPTPEDYLDPGMDHEIFPLLSVVAINPAETLDNPVGDYPPGPLVGPSENRTSRYDLPGSNNEPEDILKENEVPCSTDISTGRAVTVEGGVSTSWVDVDRTALPDFDRTALDTALITDNSTVGEELSSVDSTATVTVDPPSDDPVDLSEDTGPGILSKTKDTLHSTNTGSDVTDNSENDKTPKADPELGDGPENDGGVATRPEKLLTKLAEMAEILQAREAQILTLSSENVQLTESNSILSNQIYQLEEIRAAESEDLNEVTTEFTGRLSEMERCLQQSIREKDSYKRQVEALQEQLASRTTADELAAIVGEKDEMIAELQQEGEKLSKQQLQYANTIKKLRSREKEHEAALKSSQKTVDDKFAEIDKLRQALDKHEELEREHRETIRRLNSAVESQEVELSGLKSERDDALGKEAAFQTALDTAYREIAELHKQNAESASKAAEISASADVQAKEELKRALDVLKNDARVERETLLDQVSDLQMTITRHEQRGTRREDGLRNEILDLRQRLQEAEGRNQELTDSVSVSTRPLLRQIENLQQTFSMQAASWEGVERNLTQRLSESQSQLAAAVEKERTATDQTITIKSKFTAMESQLSILREECSKLRADADVDQSQAGAFREQVVKLEHQLAISDRSCEEQRSRSVREKTTLEHQLELEKMKSESERKKLHQFVSDQNKERDKRLVINRQDSNTDISTMMSPSSVKSNHSNSSRNNSQNMDSIEQSLLHSPIGSVYDTLRHSSLSTVIENLQSQLKQRDGEIGLQKRDVMQLEKTRASLAEEIVRLTNENEDFMSRLSDIQPLEDEIEELKSKYNVILQMYGEKEEMYEELKMDLSDVKEMYKTQINDLLQKM